MSRRVCAILVTYNRVDILKTALAHIRAQTLQPAFTIVVDNNSSDGTKEFLTSLTDKDHIHSMFLNSNIGYAGGIAYGMEYGLESKEFDYFWIMDDDSFPSNDTLSLLVNNMENSDFDILGSNGFTIRYGTKKQIVSQNQMQEADFILIDGAVIKRNVVSKVGAPSAKFFMMCEDYEYCKRLKKSGFKIGVINLDTVDRLHLGGGGKFTKNTLWRGYYHSRNHLLILRQYFSMMSLFGYMVTQAKFIVAAAVLAPDRFQRVKFRLLGIWHGLRGIDGKTLDPKSLQFQHEAKK
jgi:GT2 family glycosyltransferase